MLEIGFDQITIKNAIHTKWAGKTVHFSHETDSTNLWAKRIANEDSKKMAEQATEQSENESTHGTLVVAEYQTAGRGRLGRKWLSPAGSCVMMSLILKPDFAPQYAPMLTLVMGLSVAQALHASIKWPNDAVISGKKICGILTEMSLAGTNIQEVVIGVGINVNLSALPEEVKEIATSLYLETGETYDRNEIIGQVLQRFEMNYEKYVQTLDLTYLMEEYNNLLINKDKQVRVLNPKEPFEGIARGINEKGELLVEREDGVVEAVSAGEVSVRGLYGYV